MIVEYSLLGLEALSLIICIFEAHFISVVLILLADLIAVHLIHIVLFFLLLVQVVVIVTGALQVFDTHFIHIMWVHIVLVSTYLLLAPLLMLLMLLMPEVILLLLGGFLLEDRVVGGLFHRDIGRCWLSRLIIRILLGARSRVVMQ